MVGVHGPSKGSPVASDMGLHSVECMRCIISIRATDDAVQRVHE